MEKDHPEDPLEVGYLKEGHSEENYLLLIVLQESPTYTYTHTYTYTYTYTAKNPRK